MKTYLFLIIAFMLTACATETTIERIDGSSIPTSELNHRIQTLVDTAKVAGLAISIFNENKVVYKNTFGYSQAETKDSLRSQTVFYGASLSKSVFGYLVSQLVMDGIIDLDTPLQAYLDQPLAEIVFAKEWRGYQALKDDKRYQKITARMCLAHTTGFPNWRWLSKNGVFLPEGKIRILFEPGSRYSYSGEGLVLLQYVIENITGKGLEELARKRIFAPLQMPMSSYVWQERFEGVYCNGHTKEGDIIPKDTEDEANAAGSLETTLDDYTLFLTEILRRTQMDDPISKLLFTPQVRIQSKAQFGPDAWIDTDENDDIALSYGLGWGILQSPYGFGAFKEGHGEGFQHYSILFPEQQIGILIMSNSDNAERIFKALLALSIADTFTPWKWENYIPFDQE